MAGSPTLRELRQRCLLAGRKDGKGGATATGVRWWLKYCIYGRSINPCRLEKADAGLQARLDEETLLCDFILWLVVCQPSGRSIAARTARQYVSHVQGWHRAHFGTSIGGDVPMHRLRYVVKGIKDMLDRPSHFRRLGVRTQDLHAVLRGVLVGASKEVLVWRAALSTAFCALLRGGEFATQDGVDPKTGELFKFDAEHGLRRSDLSFFRDEAGVLHAKLMVTPLKKRVKERVAVILSAGGTLVDPVEELWRMVEADPVPERERRWTPLFRLRSGEPLRVAEVRSQVRRVMAAIGRPAADYGAHSLRIGGATAALAAGVDPSVIRLLGRWSSDCYEIYTRLNRQVAVRVGLQVGSTAFDDFESGFQSEVLELLPSEYTSMPQVDLDDFRGAYDSEAEDDEEDEL